MSEIDAALRELGLTWEEIDAIPTTPEKEWVWYWENYQWDDLLRLHHEHGLGTDKELELIERYKNREGRSNVESVGS